MVKFSAPEHTKGPLAGWSVTGRWVSVKRDPEWRGEVGYEVYDYMHHYEPAGNSQSNVDELVAMRQALRMWFIESQRRDPTGQSWRRPDHVSVDAVYQSSLSGPAGSDHDPFVGLEGTGHDGYDPFGKSKQRGKVGE